MRIIKLILVGLTLLFLNNCQSNNVQIIAHRGGAKLAPENTLAAFKNAIDIGVDMIEIDVILSKDNKVIVIHDDSIDRTTNGSGKVKEMTLSKIKSFDAGSWFDEKYKDEKIPTLDEVIKLLNGQVKLLIEIKGGNEEYAGLEEKVVEVINNYEAHNWVIVQSFNEETVIRIKDANEKITTFYLLGKNGVEYLEKLKNNEINVKKYDGLAPNYQLVTKENIALIKKLDFKCFVWTVNDVELMNGMIHLKVDGIITDSPDILKDLL
ncbi:MAG: glycerophosphodiester phosphodiesterase [Ignavibacteriales bacterium]|nr:glycerophosphodiester phosphodiesterase [Ignavibacteriales bacterium]MCB9208774.1 glycerophosphodiester phosphodiesterase [Ignavibacteriales bacterium]MCB9218308.1 glycerophosphodiester phosphodiesterase [Ignavibacteriales bacterium]